MKQSFLIFLLLLNITACVTTSSPIQAKAQAQAQVQVQVQETNTFADVAKTIANKTQVYSSAQVLVVVDIDNTVLTSESDLGGDIWYQWQRGNLAVKPSEEQKVACLFEDSISLLYELGPMELTEPSLPQMIETWQKQGVTVFALTSRSPKNRAATERELSRAGVNFSLNPLSHKDQTTPILREFVPREMTYMQGIMMTSGMNKGLMLKYILDKVQRQYDAIIFVDDSQKNIDNLYEEFKDTGNVDMTIFHYTKVEEERIAANGEVLTQQQADLMAKQWQDLNRLLGSIFPSRTSGKCLNNN
jgi:head-tail adaptor